MKNKNIFTIFSGVLLLGCSVTVSAQGYSNELSAWISNHEVNDDATGTTFTAKTNYLYYSYYFQPINNTSYPYAESDFVSREQKILLRAGTFKAESELNGSKDSYDGNLVLFGYVYRSVSSPLYLAAGFETYKLDGEHFGFFNGTSDTDSTIYHFVAGYYIQESMLLGFGYEKSDRDTTYSFLPGETFNVEEESISLDYKYLIPLASESAFNVAFSYEKSDRELDDGTVETTKDAEMWMTYYFNRNLSIGLGLNDIKSDDNDDEGRGTTLSGSYFVNPQVAFALAYGEFDPDESQRDENTWWLNATVRF